MTTMLTKQFRVFRGPSAVVNAIGPNVLALAGFDGVHTGHRALLRRAAEAAAELGLTTRIRDRLGLGDIETVNQLLGRRYKLTATVREAVGRHVRATVPPARMIPALGEYIASVDYTSNAVQSRVRTTVAVRSGGVGRPGQLTIALDQAVDHGRLLIGFIRRAPAGGTGEPSLFEFGTR